MQSSVYVSWLDWASCLECESKELSVLSVEVSQGVTFSSVLAVDGNERIRSR